MDKLNFQKAIDSLKNKDCNTKEKVTKFQLIESSLSALQNHSNYKSFLSNAVQILLLFCEDNDSNCRISAEENLNRVIRSAEKQHQITLVQVDLYHEIKKNGNERSLRICLHLFSYYSHLIKHRRRKVYAQNLLPCMLAIGKRREILVIEAFAEYMKNFCKNSLNFLTDGELMKLLDLFFTNLTVECAIMKRCCAQNIITVIENSTRSEFLIKKVVKKIQENLMKSNENNTLIGTFGLLRLMMPILARNDYHEKILEILESCLNILKNDQNHTIINANLEAIASLLNAAENLNELKFLLTDDQKMSHKDILLSRRSIMIRSRKSSDTETLRTADFLHIPVGSSIMSTPNKSLTSGNDFSDVEGDSFKSTDFEVEVPSSTATMRHLLERGAESMSLKSTDSLNSFFNSIATNSETVVSKLFRKASTESPSHQPKSFSESIDERSFEISISQFKDESTEQQDSQTVPEAADCAIEEFKLDETNSEMMDSIVSVPEREIKDLYIGTMFDQSVVEYIVRLVSSKFLLEGIPKLLISDQISRVSVKNVALSVISSCVNIKSETLLMKLQKDFTDESMMVERLLSYLIDEDLRLEEEEKKRNVQSSEDGANVSTSLEIKDDHFGECTTATFLDYFSPLSKNLDEEGLITLKNRIFEEKSKSREESTKKINRDLSQLLSRSEMSSDSRLPLMETTLKMPEDKDCQFIVDVLLYASHSDPVLRSNAYTIAGIFLQNVLSKNYDFDKFISKSDYTREELQFEKLIKLIKNGLRDEAHTVVKQTLVVTERLIRHLPIFMSKTSLNDFLLHLFNVNLNKYWLVQCTYADVLLRINNELLEDVLGSADIEFIQDKISQQFFELIKDSDFRVRNHVSDLLPEFVTSFSNQSAKQSPLATNHLKSFLYENVTNFDSFFFENKHQNHDVQIEKQLTKILYLMTNFLMDIKNRNQLFGAIYALKVLVRRFSPIEYQKVWKEFNIVNVLLSYINKNPSIALDVSCQCDMLEIISTLIGATPLESQVQCLTLHILKILNIYAHLINDTKPLIVPPNRNKGTDLFTSSRELAIINSMGFFSSEQFYLKLYLVLKSSYDSFRMTINHEAEAKLRLLLHINLKSLQTVFELRNMSPEHVKLVEESVQYLNQIMMFQPSDCIVTTRILLKFLFSKNYVNRQGDIDAMRLMADQGNSEQLFVNYEKFSRFDLTEINLDNNLATLIKQLDPLVIQVLRLFSKSAATLQTSIVEMLCQLLEFNVNYMQLDAKKVFVELVMRHLDYIESGLVMNGEILAPRIIQFLIFLTKLKDKKIITIPKILNIIDNLLAMSNPRVRECGIEALFVLTSEVFFKRHIIRGDVETIEALQKEMSALREVVVSMLLKFLDKQSVQERLCWILLKSRTNQNFDNNVIDEAEIHQQLIECMEREQEIEHQLLGVISKNILLESKSFEQVLSIYWQTLESGNVDENSTKYIILVQEQVLSRAEEFYLINHIKLYQERQAHFEHVHEDEPLNLFTQLHLKFLINAILGCQSYRVVRKLLRFMGFKKQPISAECLKNVLNVYDILKASARNVSTFESCIQFFLWTDVKTDEILKCIRNLKNFNISVLLNIFYKQLFIKKTDINGWENHELMEFFKDVEHLEILLKYSKNVLLDNLFEDEKISKIILKKLSMTKARFMRKKYIVENSHGSCLTECLNYVLAESVKDSQDARALQLVAVKKLHLLKNDILIGKESVEVSLEDIEKFELKIFDFKLNEKCRSFTKAVNDFLVFIKLRINKESSDVDDSDFKRIIDETWFLSHLKHFIYGSKEVENGKQIAQVLLEIRSEMKLAALMTHNDFNVKLLSSTLDVGFSKMLSSFRVDCIQINPHLSYMKISPLLKTSILILMKNLENLDESSGIDIVEILSSALSIFLKWIRKIYNDSLIYVESKYIEKFIADNLLKSVWYSTLGNFLKLAIVKMEAVECAKIECYIEVINEIIMNHCLWDELRTDISDKLLNIIHSYLMGHLKATEIHEKYRHPQLFDEIPDEYKQCVVTAKQVIFIAKCQDDIEEKRDIDIQKRSERNIRAFLRISRNLLRFDKFYQFAITPYEILQSYRSADNLLVMDQSHANFKLKQIPIEYLSDSELLEKYIRRINRFGFTQRQQFEEVFMTLLVLLNQWNEMHDAEERFHIKRLCLQLNVDLIASCYRFPHIGLSENPFFHLPRCEKIRLDSVGMKKLHHIQNTLDAELNVLYQSNLERIEMKGKSNLISTSTFELNQVALNYNWQMIESSEEVAAMGSMLSRDILFYHERAGIDFKSALQLIYDLITQMIDDDFIIVLPQLAKLIDILENSDQFRWINKKMWTLYENIAEEDTVSHQYIAYLLCRSSAVLVSSLQDVQQLLVVINKYLSCNQIFVRTAALQGLLCLFECFCKTNTTMGAMSDEMKILKNCIVSYTNKHGIASESSVMSSKHDKLVWTLNFYVIEMTSKFAGDCYDLVIDSMISANNILKRTCDYKLFYLIMNGLERLVILNSSNKMYREKVEKLSVDLMKTENKLYATGGLKLLVTCLYIGSMEQLENTEKSNGIVQDEPEILMQSTEKIEILFSRIRTATVDEADMFGRVLGQILRDLLPPNEVLTKIIKELLIMNQSNCVCIASIIHQVFRSAIDSSYLTLLQEFLICSLSNFLSYPNSRKSIWFLTIIFLSSTLNQHLLKLFPILLDENIEETILHKIFLVTARDFNEQLSKQQKILFKEAFENRMKMNMMSSSVCSISPINSVVGNNNLFTILLKHL